MKYFCKYALLSLIVMATAISPALPQQALPPKDAQLGKIALGLLSEAMKSDGSQVRLTAVETWGEIGNPAAIPVLKKALEDPDAYVRIAAAQSLFSLHNREGIAVLKSIIRENASPDDERNPIQEMLSLARNKARIRAIEVLSGIGGKSAQETLEAALNDPAGDVRDAAAIGLARMGDSDYVPQFFEALSSKDESVRIAAVSALGAIASPDAVEALAKAASDPSVHVRRAVMRSLSVPVDPAVIDLLTGALKDADPNVKALALGKLAQLGDPGSTELLKKILKKSHASDEELKASAGLARRGEKVDLSLAQLTLSQKDDDLKKLALDVLRADDSEASTDLLAKMMKEDADPEMKIAAAAILVKRLQRPPGPAR